MGANSRMRMAISFIDGLKQSALWFPSYSQTASHNGLGKSEVPAQFGKAPSDTPDGQSNTSASVSVLNRLTSPNAIIRLVIAIAILALNRHPIGFFTHILKEIRKGIFPPIAHPYSPASVVFKAFVFWVKASSLNSFPSRVCRAFVATVSSPSVTLCASTGLGCPTDQVRGSDSLFNTAIASAKAFCVTSYCLAIRNNNKFGKPISDQALSFWHGIIKLMFCNWRKPGDNSVSAESFIRFV